MSRWWSVATCGRKRPRWGAALDNDTVAAELEIVEAAHRLWGREDRDLDLQIGQFVGGHGRETRVLKGGADGDVPDGVHQRLLRVKRAHAAAEAAQLVKRDEHAAVRPGLDWWRFGLSRIGSPGGVFDDLPGNGRPGWAG